MFRVNKDIVADIKILIILSTHGLFNKYFLNECPILTELYNLGSPLDFPLELERFNLLPPSADSSTLAPPLVLWSCAKEYNNATTSFGSTIRTNSKYSEALIEKDFWIPVPCCLRWNQVSPVKLFSETVLSSLANRPDALSILSPSFIVVNTFIFKLCCVLDENLVVWSLFMVNRVIKFT